MKTRFPSINGPAHLFVFFSFSHFLLPFSFFFVPLIFQDERIFRGCFVPCSTTMVLSLAFLFLFSLRLQCHFDVCVCMIVALSFFCCCCHLSLSLAVSEPCLPVEEENTMRLYFPLSSCCFWFSFISFLLARIHYRLQ